jgi:hypothetical protein
MISGLISLIVWLLVVGILYLLLVWVLDSVPIPQPANRIIKLVAVVVICIIAILLLLNLIGMGGDLRMPQIKVQ